MNRNFFTNSNTNNNDNDTENWSYPAGFERFNSVNIPRSRLGKRRTIHPSSEVKRSILTGISTEKENKEYKDDLNKIACQSSSLTHPVNPFLTPKYKTADRSSEKNLEESIDNPSFDLYSGQPTPVRNVGSHPLQEVKNNVSCEKQIFNPKKLYSASSERKNLHNDIRKILNKSFEDEKSVNSSLENSRHCSSSNNEELANHSSHAKSSSSMTPQDAYNFDTNKNCQKTPGKGFGLFDIAESPLVSGNKLPNEDENDSFKNFFVKTPGLSRYDMLCTPYQTRVNRNVFTPFNSKTPQRNIFTNLPEVEMECDEPMNLVQSNNSVPLIEDGINKCNIVPDSTITFSRYEENVRDSATHANNFSIPFETEDSHINMSVNDSNISRLSPGKIVKKEIFEGLGWNLPNTSLVVDSPTIDRSSKYMNKDSTNLLLSRLEPSVMLEPEINSKTKSENEYVQQNKKCTNSSNNNKNELVKSVNLINNQDVTSTTTETNEKLVIDKATVATPIFTESKYILNKNSSIHVSNTSEIPILEVEISENKPDSIYLSTDKNKNNCLNNSSTDENTCTIVNNTKSQKCEINEKTNTNNTVILKPPSPQIVVEKPIVEEPLKKDNAMKPNQERNVNQHTLFEPQIPLINTPQSNVIYVNNKPYTVLSMLGKGGSSEVFRVLDTSSSKLMALKFVNLSSVEETVANGYLNEIDVLSKLQGCPSVIKMFDNEYISESKILYVLMEIGDTDFSRLMKDIAKTKKISMPMIIYYWTEMLNAVKDIHEKGIIHSDLKPANFLLVSGRLKLIDFGIASSLQGDMTSVLKDVTTGTFNYMSPEAIRNSGETRGHKINKKSDIWSLGCILYNLIYGRTPFSHLTNTWSKLQAIADPETCVMFPPGSSAPPHLLLSVRWALTKDPTQRPTAEELLQLAELAPGPETQLGRQISSLLGEYILQMFPNCRVKFEIEKPKDTKQGISQHR